MIPTLPSLANAMVTDRCSMRYYRMLVNPAPERVRVGLGGWVGLGECKYAWVGQGWCGWMWVHEVDQEGYAWVWIGLVPDSLAYDHNVTHLAAH